MGKEIGGYSLYHKFNLEKHKQTFVKYLEVVIDSDGEVHYAVPSHQEKAIRMTCQKLGVSRDELMAMCPREYWCDMFTWLCKVGELVLVWDNSCAYYKPTVKQIGTLRRLKMGGVYTGEIPSISRNGGENNADVLLSENC